MHSGSDDDDDSFNSKSKKEHVCVSLTRTFSDLLETIKKAEEVISELTQEIQAMISDNLE